MLPARSQSYHYCHPHVRSLIFYFCRTVPAGTAVSYKGTDYLQVDLETRLIYNVTSSSDLLNWYIALGYDVIAEQT